MVAENLIPNKMCGGKKRCEASKNQADNPTANEDEKILASERWWAKTLGLQSSNGQQADEQEILQEGSLWIRSFSALKNSGDWQPLFFVLCPETLYYINKQASPSTFSGAIAIKDISSIIPEDGPSDNGNGGHCVRVRTKNENFVLHWRSAERRDKWVTSLLYAKSLSILEQKAPKEHKGSTAEHRVGDLVKFCLPIVALPCRSHHTYTDLTRVN